MVFLSPKRGGLMAKTAGSGKGKKTAAVKKTKGKSKTAEKKKK